jgi:hypothetical protein
MPIDIGAFGRHCDIRQRARFIDKSQPLGSLFCDQTCRFAQTGGHRPALVYEIGTGLRVQVFEVNRRIVEKPTRDPVSQRRALTFIAVRDMLIEQGVQPLVQRDGRPFGRPGRRAPHGRQHAGERWPVHVVERVCLIASTLHEGIFIAGNTLQHAQA